MERQIIRQVFYNRQNYTFADIQTDRRTDKQTNIQTDRQTDGLQGIHTIKPDATTNKKFVKCRHIRRTLESVLQNIFIFLSLSLSLPLSFTLSFSLFVSTVLGYPSTRLFLMIQSDLALRKGGVVGLFINQSPKFYKTFLIRQLNNFWDFSEF